MFFIELLKLCNFGEKYESVVFILGQTMLQTATDNQDEFKSFVLTLNENNRQILEKCFKMILSAKSNLDENSKEDKKTLPKIALRNF
jgi:hypothetical protein